MPLASTQTQPSAQPQPNVQVNNPSLPSEWDDSADPQLTNDSPVVFPVAAVQSVASFESENHTTANPDTIVADIPPQPTAISHTAQLSQVTPTPVQPTPAIVLQIDNVRPSRGKVKVAVFTEPNSFLVKDRAAQTLELTDATQMVTAEIDIKQPCAIAVFQDIDGDGELTRNRRGIPVEPCGFSNNAVIKRGPPQFADAAVKPASDSTTKVLIRLP